MADIVETRLNSALKAIEDIAESGGYRKKEVKEGLMQAVSDIQDCFKILKNDFIVKETEKKEPACEVNDEVIAVDLEEDDSTTKGQHETAVPGADWNITTNDQVTVEEGLENVLQLSIFMVTANDGKHLLGVMASSQTRQSHHKPLSTDQCSNKDSVNGPPFLTAENR
ncbi:hypothetical protein C0J52_15137 [Blattella germanica]|nr:hypothetical protein C0J52_15137 [Blattella germanica]